LKTFVNKDLLKVGITRERDSLFLGNRKISLWSNQDSPGVHPFVLELGEPSTGYLFHNYNALEVETFNNSLAFRAVGGVMDLFVFIGKTGEDIVRELHKIQGLPELPRFSALGHHYGSHSLKSPQDIKELLDFFQENSLPIDSLWLLNLSISTNFSLFSELSTFLPSNLSISLELSSEIQKKTTNLDFSPILLETENEEKSYIDWFHPDAESVWSSYLSSINSSIDFTGLSLINNQVDTKEITSSPDVPFIPKDLCMECGSIDLSTVHNNSYTELDLHSLWGDMQVKATRSWFLIGNKRPLLLSSSTKTGTRAAHVISYESTSWSSLRDALASALSYEIVGIRSGSNPCGFKFNEKISDNLCSKWQGLSAVLPLFVNFKQEEVQKLRLFQGKSLEDLKKSIEIRYSLSLFIYSLYFEASLHGGTIVRSPMFNFFDLDLKEFPSQVMIGDGLMVIFPLDKSENTKFYLPAGKWYDLDTGKQRKAKEIITDKIDSTGLFILKGGFIIPVVDSSNTMNILQVRDRFLTIIVALSETYEAKGSFFVDDGISLDSIQSKKFTKVLFRADVRDGLDIFVESIVKGFVTQFKVIEKFKIYGCPPPAYVNINGRRGVFSYIDDVLVVKTDLDTYSDIRISINFK
jgi:alpha-glucosidase (family GH31 glycosyl hydrolase)